MELIRIRCTAATAIKSCEAILAFVLGIDIAKLEFFHDIVSFYTMEYITQFELIVSNKLMTELGFKEISIEPVVTPDENDYAIREEDLPPFKSSL